MDTAEQPKTETGNTQAFDSSKDVEENKDIAALGYVWILSVFVYFAKRNSPFVRFHAKQGMVLFLLSIPLWFIPFVGTLLELVILALAVLGFIGAAQGLWKELPLIGAIARRDKQGIRKSWKNVTDAAAQNWPTKPAPMPTSDSSTPPSV